MCLLFSLFFAGLLASSVITGAASYTADTPIRLLELLFWLFLRVTLAWPWPTISLLFVVFTIIFFGREGYLTWTLPTSSHTVLLAKATSALIWSIFCFISLVLSLVIFLGVIGLSQQQNIFDVLGPVFEHIGSSLIWQSLLFQVLATISGILMLYCAISLGQLFINIVS